MIEIDRDWIEGPAPSAPDEQEVLVLVFPLDETRPRPDLEGLLAPDERKRAAAFHFERDRGRFVVARATLRRILGRALDIEPPVVTFAYGLRGKPCLAPGGRQDLRFNLSHSHGLALCAVSRGRELGVDVEQVRPEVEILRIARRFFTPDEHAALLAVPPAGRREAFFRCWTCKEAYLKAIGQGLFRCSTTFDVTVAPGEPAALRRVHDDPAEAGRWGMRDLSPAPGFVGAVLAEGRDWRLTRSRLRP